MHVREVTIAILLRFLLSHPSKQGLHPQQLLQTLSDAGPVRIAESIIWTLGLSHNTGVNVPLDLVESHLPNNRVFSLIFASHHTIVVISALAQLS